MRAPLRDMAMSAQTRRRADRGGSAEKASRAQYGFARREHRRALAPNAPDAAAAAVSQREACQRMPREPRVLFERKRSAAYALMLRYAHDAIYAAARIAA
jgi:hypothetical protein